ncbi:MAG: PocR ligand-binding domain-containing protein [Candidatus Omnitrophota bacterium]
MKRLNIEKFARQYIDRERWAPVLSRFIEVLKINMFVIDREGQTVIPPASNGGRKAFGSHLLMSGLDRGLREERKRAGLGLFDHYGDYLEYTDQLGFSAFAVPLVVGRMPFAHLIVGPVCMSRRADAEECRQNSERLGMDPDAVCDALQNIRVMSHLQLKSVLDLLSSVTQEFIVLRLEKGEADVKRRPAENHLGRPVLPQGKAGNGFPQEVLTIAARISGAEAASLMLWSEEDKALIVESVWGTAPGKPGAKMGLHDGISGLVLRRGNVMMLRSDDAQDDEVRPYLKRPQIRQSVIVPLFHEKRPVGVLNVHTKSSDKNLFPAGDSLKLFAESISPHFHFIS